MAKSLGSPAVLRVSLDGETAWVAVGKVKSISLPPSINMIDVTDNDSGGNKEKLPGDSDFKLSVTANYDSVDAGQVLLIDTVADKAALFYSYRPRGSATGEIDYTGQGYLTKVQIDAKHEAVMELAFDVEFTGGVTKSVQ